jgi:predicted RecB family nuclease
MFNKGNSLQLSASDLVGHLNCRHLTDLDVEALQGKIERRYFHDPLLDILTERGNRHEKDYLAHLTAKGYDVVRIPGAGVAPGVAEQTLSMMKAGVPIIAQGALLNGTWSGRADILRRVNTPSVFGDWSYDVIDTKLARETKAGTVLQLSLYSDLLSLTQGVAPECMHVVTPGSGFERQSFRTAAFAAYYRYVKRRLEQSLAQRVGIDTYPDPKEHCDICSWRVNCDARRRLDDHLCLVAGITKIQIAELKRHSIDSTAKLARAPVPLPWKPDRGARQSYERSREQARVQVEARTVQKPIHEVLTPSAGLGLHKLPQPSAGDVFFDLEGDPFVGEGGLEYLFGYVSLTPGAEPAYIKEWAFTREQEAQAFRRFVDYVMARWAQHPDMHVYHYAPYEPSALKRLMGRYATCEDEIDRMLRGNLFVDLYTVARQSVRASVERYSIKNLEVFYGYERPVALPDARRALATMEGCLELDDLAGITDDVKSVIAGYNRDDCISALELRDWLEAIRTRLIEEGTEIPRPSVEPSEPSEELGEQQKKVAELVARLTADIPLDKEARTAEQQARWILAHTLDWHRREQKSVWWEYYRLAGLPAEDLVDERCALSGLTFESVVGGTAKAPAHRYAFPLQDVELRKGDALCAVGGEDFGDIEAISFESRTLDIKKRGKTAALHPAAVFRHNLVRAKPKPEALLRIGEHVAERGMSDAVAYRPARDLLLRRPPQLGNELLRKMDETPVQAAVRIACTLTGGVLPIQGPPGAGKTFTAARMICALVAAGKRVGITANSHKVIRHLLDEVVKAADQQGIDLQCIQKPDTKQESVHRIRFSTTNEEVLEAIRTTCQVAAATAWLWSREDAFEAVDVLFVDEAAQMSLADVLAVSQACKMLVLLGDPQQLEQPMQGSHPEGTDVSALDHILGGHATLAEQAGLFLEETWRLHPDICAFTSELFYEGRLHSRAGHEIQTVKSRSRVNGTGLRYLAVPHEGNQSSAPEEADRIRELVNEILEAPSTWVDRHGDEKPVTLNDVLIIAPYNAQVFELQERLSGARIGTVDKFQGQEAAIVIYSMTTSSHADAPRGMEFLYSLNRLNVATSRAMCLCILVGSPALFEPECRTPQQMRMANAFCRYLEIATLI